MFDWTWEVPFCSSLKVIQKHLQVHQRGRGKRERVLRESENITRIGYRPEKKESSTFCIIVNLQNNEKNSLVTAAPYCTA